MTGVLGRAVALRRNPAALGSLIIIVLSVGCAVAAPYVAPHPPGAQDLEHRLTPPVWFGGTSLHWLGTDGLGQDILARLVFGSRVAIIVGVSAVLAAMVIGIVLGLVAGWYGGWAGTVIMRVGDLVFAFPFLLLALLLVTLLGGGLGNIIIALSATGWVIYARLVRGEILAMKDREFIQAARSIGASTAAILFREALPNLMTSLLVIGTLEVGTAILSEASLSFLGVGIPPSVPDWGQMVEAGRNYMYKAWWVATEPGLAIALLVLGVNLFGDWLREAMDPLMRSSGRK